MAAGSWRFWGRLASSGPASLTDPLQFRTGPVIWVDSLNGDDANTGKIKEKPKKTIGSANTAAVAGATIALLPGFSQSITSLLTLTKQGLYIVGAGLGTQQARLIQDAAAGIFNVTAAGVGFDNLFFPASATVGLVNPRITIPNGAYSALVKDCLFDLGVNDPAGVDVESADADLSGCTFRSVTSQARSALLVNGGAGNRVLLNDCVFDGGTTGWKDNIGKQICIWLTAGTLRARGLVLKNHSDVYIASDTDTAIADIHFSKPEDLGEDCSVLFGSA